MGGIPRLGCVGKRGAEGPASSPTRTATSARPGSGRRSRSRRRRSSPRKAAAARLGKERRRLRSCCLAPIPRGGGNAAKHTARGETSHFSTASLRLARQRRPQVGDRHHQTEVAVRRRARSDAGGAPAPRRGRRRHVARTGGSGDRQGREERGRVPQGLRPQQRSRRSSRPAGSGAATVRTCRWSCRCPASRSSATGTTTSS